MPSHNNIIIMLLLMMMLYCVVTITGRIRRPDDRREHRDRDMQRQRVQEAGAKRNQGLPRRYSVERVSKVTANLVPQIYTMIVT